MSGEAETPEVLSLTDLDAVEALRECNNGTLGFLAKRALAQYLESAGGLGVKNEDGYLVAYLLFGEAKSHIRIIHLCVADHARGEGHAAALIDALKHEVKRRRIGVVRLNCRRDYAAHEMWPKLGFVPLDVKPAKTPGRELVQWYLVLEELQNQGDLFYVETMEDRTNAVIDAQVFFDLHGGDSSQTVVSKGLQADFLSDMLQLFITDEMFLEIDRSESPTQRETSRKDAHSFARVKHDPDKADEFEHKLRNILPSRTPSQISDIRQLAKTAASSVDTFVTHDRKLLGAAVNIQEFVGVQVLDPTQLVGQVHKLANRDSYVGTPLSGAGLVWRRLSRDDFPCQKVNEFLGPQEKKVHFENLLNESLAQPEEWHTQGLFVDEKLVAVRAFQFKVQGRFIEVSLCRSAHGPERELLTRFVIASVLYEAVGRHCEEVRLRPRSVAPDAVDELMDLGFIESRNGYIRLCLTNVVPFSEAQRRLQDIGHGDLVPEDAETYCSPAALSDVHGRYLLVPIKPGYAQQIFDLNRAREDLIGSDRSILLRWTNVYFRRKSHHRLLTPPARILWYVSGQDGGIVAVSRLDEVKIGSPKDMFRKHRRLGALRWSDIYQMCRGGKIQEIMVLQFSHTYLFNKVVRLDELRKLHAEHSAKLVVQSPAKVSRNLFLDIFRSGFSKSGSVP